jgi:hemerythrin superfamily protein
MAHGGDIIRELTTDHDEVDGIFREIESLPSGEQRRKELADQATIELVRHSIAEEEYLYPTVRRRVPEGDRIADKEIQDHAAVERIMKELEGCEATDERFDRLIGSLIADVREHVRDEEGNLFPAMRESCSQDELTKLGDKTRRAKMMAPTRPHPAAPDKPPLNKLLAPGAGLVDRARDAISGRGKG